jgi:competence protein ComEC
MAEMEKDIKKIKRPFFFVGLFLIMGIVMGAYIPVNLFVSFVLFLVCLLSSCLLMRTRFFYLLVIILCVLTGILRYNVAAFVREDNITHQLKDQKDIIILGYVANHPTKNRDRFKRSRSDFNFRLTHIIKDHNIEDVSGLLKVYSLDSPLKSFEYGLPYAIEGNFKPLTCLDNDDQQGYKNYLEKKHINGIFYSNKYNSASRLAEKSQANIAVMWMGRLRSKISDSYKELFEEPYCSLLSTLILGERSNIDKKIFNYFVNSGSVHVLAISGLHVGIIILFIIFVFRIFGFNRRQTAFLGIIFLILYCFLCGARISVIRASIMASVILGGYILKRDSDIYNSLGLAAFLILMFDPFNLFDIGFQLSFISVLAIVYLYPKIKVWLLYCVNLKNSKKNIGKVSSYLIDAVCVSLAASIAVAPLSLYYFKQVSSVSVLTNIIVLPLLSVVITLGLIVSIISSIHMPLARFFAEALWFFMSLMIKAAESCAALPFSVIKIANFKITYLLLSYLFLVILFHLDVIVRWFKAKIMKSIIE